MKKLIKEKKVEKNEKKNTTTPTTADLSPLNVLTPTWFLEFCLKNTTSPTVIVVQSTFNVQRSEHFGQLKSFRWQLIGENLKPSKRLKFKVLPPEQHKPIHVLNWWLNALTNKQIRKDNYKILTKKMIHLEFFIIEACTWTIRNSVSSSRILSFFDFWWKKSIYKFNKLKIWSFIVNPWYFEFYCLNYWSTEVWKPSV